LYLGFQKRVILKTYCSLRLHYNLFKIRWDKFIVKGISFEEQTAFCLYHSLYKRDIPETSYYSLSSNALQPVQVRWYKSIRKGILLGEHSSFSSVPHLL
jgi:hypothetical protein